MLTTNNMATSCGLKFVIITTIVVVMLIIVEKNTCKGFEIYFPISSINLNLPLNEKAESIFSKIPIGRFQVLATANNGIATDYIYNLEQNDILRVNSTTGEVFIKHDYRAIKQRTKVILTALPKNEALNKRTAHMSIELNPQSEEEYCHNMENICFWNAAHYTIVEDDSNAGAESSETFVPLEVGTLNPRGAKYICPSTNLKYILDDEASKHFALNNNTLYTKAAFDYESLNTTATKNLTISVKCLITPQKGEMKTLQKILNITVVDRNDNGPMLQHNKMYHFNLENPHFKANDFIGEKIIFIDKDSLVTNAHLTYVIKNDTNNIVHPVCNAYETDHTGSRSTVISCQIIFTRSGILSQSMYCFVLEAADGTIDVNITKSVQAQICLHTDVNQIHEADRPLALALRAHHHRKSTNIVASEESMLNAENSNYGRNIITPNIFITYPKDVSIYRNATLYYRVAQPDEFIDLRSRPEIRFSIAEDRTGAFAITPLAGIIYVKDTTALQHSPEMVYFLNITWHDRYQRSFVINVHLSSGRPNNATCEHKIKSRSQTCAQIKYQKYCTNFCGLATDGGTCEWRGSNDASFSRNFASCVPNATYCPDNVCDPLEEVNPHICPQDCTQVNKIVGPHSSNDNNRGILSASGTCTCEDNGKCSCAPLDDDEPKPKRKRKNDSKLNILKFSNAKTAASNNSFEEEQSIFVSGFSCGKSCLIIAITCPLVFIILIICFVVSRRNLIRKTLGKEAHSTLKGSLHRLEGGGIGGDCDIRNGDLPLIQMENIFKFDESDSKWEFDRKQLILDAVLGEGEFGKVMKGYATDIAGLKGVTTVAVKMLKNGANSVEYMALLSEFQLLQEVSHPNVIKLLGACTKGDALMIIIEYARYGSLRSYLRLSRKIECAGVDFTDGVEPVTVKNILSFAWQICKGMTYLTEIKLVHRDLAARNVLLADGKICKVSDFGLTRDVYEDDAYLKRSRDRVPVKWMAPESLADHVYTTKSDVWAFGVLCWELITLGASPYPGVPPQNLYHLLKTGYRMERPENCSEEVYSIVRSCWTDDSNARPSFKYLASQFEKLLGNNAKYIELETTAISNPMYCSDEAKHASKSDLTKLTNEWGEPDCLDHLWQPPKISYDSFDCSNNSRDCSTTFSAVFQPPPGYDMPRPLIEASSTEQKLRYENDLRFPLNIRKSVCGAASVTSNSLNGSKCGIEHYSIPVKHGRSYVDMTNKTLIPDNLDNNDFEKHISKTISFRFSSLLNLNEQDATV